MASYNKKVLLINFLVFFLFILDRISKWLALNILPREGFFIFPKTVGLILERNQGIAYSIPLSSAVLIVVLVIIIAILIFLLVRAYQKKELAIVFSLTLIIIGAFSNFLDRLHYSYVVDLITLTSWPVFNLADVMITAGVVIILWKMLRNKSNNLTPHHDSLRSSSAGRDEEFF
jgi:signal peptidase II